MLLASLLAATGCGSRSALEEIGVHEGGTFLDVRTDPLPRDASVDAVADRSIDAREEPSDVPDAGPPIDACVPRCEGRSCGAIDGCGGKCAVGPCPDGLH